MRHFLEGILLSFSYFSIVPLPIKKVQNSQSSYSGMLFGMPLVGLIMGLMTVGLFTLLKEVMPLTYSAILSACFYLVLYGFLHLEAVCDVVDAWFASLSEKDVYAIMKEPHIGAIGALGVFVLVLLKVAAIATLFIHGFQTLFLAAIIFSRLGLIFGLNWFEFHKNSSFAKQLKKSAKGRLLIVMLLVYTLFAFFVLDVPGIGYYLLLSFFGFALLLWVLKKRFTFLNGDCLGFSLEAVEFALLNLGLVLL